MTADISSHRDCHKYSIVAYKTSDENSYGVHILVQELWRNCVQYEENELDWADLIIIQLCAACHIYVYLSTLLEFRDAFGCQRPDIY